MKPGSGHPAGVALDVANHPLGAALGADQPFQTPTVRHYSRGSFIATPGAGGNTVFVLQQGRLRVFLSGEDKELTLAFLEPGEVYCTHTRAWVEAVTDCTLLMADTAHFQGRLLADPALMLVTIRVFARLLARSIDIIENLAFRDVAARLANFLLGLARGADPALPAGLRIPVQLRTEDIARLLGTSRQTVSSLINQLVREGVIARDGRRAVLLLDPAELKRRAQGG